MEEGKRLSLTNSKQAKELKRLKDVENDFEAQRKLLNDAMDEINEKTDKEAALEKELAELKQKMSEQEKTFDIMKNKLNSKEEAHDDLQLAEQRCQSQKLHISQLEERVDHLMTAQREAAEQIAECKYITPGFWKQFLFLANAPLLHTIEELEDRLKESDSAKCILQKKIRFTEEKLESAEKKAAEAASISKQQLESLRIQTASYQQKIQSLER